MARYGINIGLNFYFYGLNEKNTLLAARFNNHFYERLFCVSFRFGYQAGF
jgi:hypothetical protein